MEALPQTEQVPLPQAPPEYRGHGVVWARSCLLAALTLDPHYSQMSALRILRAETVAQLPCCRGGGMVQGGLATCSGRTTQGCKPLWQIHLTVPHCVIPGAWRELAAGMYTGKQLWDERKLPGCRTLAHKVVPYTVLGCKQGREKVGASVWPGETISFF